METKPTLGVDVCKAFLDACLLSPGGSRSERRFANDARGIAALLAWAGPAGTLGMESTGGYERDLALAGLLVRVENPRRVRDFARATGRLNKADRADARAIAEFLSKVDGRPWRLADPVARELEGLSSHRAALCQERTRLGNRLERRAALPGLAVRHIEARLDAIDREVEEVEQARRATVANDAGLARDLRALVALKGVREASAMLILARAGNVEDYDSAQSHAAAAGLAPCRSESGTQKGKTRMSRQGDAALRSGLFLSAVSASRYAPVLREFRERLIANGKTKMQAVIACMRKLLMRVYGILKAVRRGETPFYGKRPRAPRATPA